MVKRWCEKRIDSWETELATRSTDRIVRPFDWGEEWADNWPVKSLIQSPELRLQDLNRKIVEQSEEFFAYRGPTDFHFENGELQFTSPVKTPYPANNTVHARWFPAHPRWQRKNQRGNKAVVLLPHWNSSPQQHVALCQGIAKLGISALRISLPYHDKRMPPELTRADYAVSSNIGRTIDATRQAVIDVRACYDWLQQQGFTDLGLVGTSLGSAYGFLASAHDDRIKCNVFNHVSTYFADVVWQGLSTRHIRAGIEDEIDIDRLRLSWNCLSPINYMDRFAKRGVKSFFLYGTYDTTFPPELSKQIIDRVKERGLKHKVVVMPCGHYTLGESPFKFMAGYHIINFLKRNL